MRRLCFVWGRAPPIVTQDTVATVRDSELEAWDTPFDESDALDLSSLKEFEGTDFSQMLRCMSGPGKRKSQPESRSQSPARSFSEDVHVNLDPHPPKRHCSLTHSHAQSLTDISISALIPLVRSRSPVSTYPMNPAAHKVPVRVRSRITMRHQTPCVHRPLRSTRSPPFESLALIVPLSRFFIRPSHAQRGLYLCVATRHIPVHHLRA